LPGKDGPASTWNQLVRTGSGYFGQPESGSISVSATNSFTIKGLQIRCTSLNAPGPAMNRGQGLIPDRIRAAIRAVRERQIFDEAAPVRERSSPELIPISTGPIPVLRLQCGRAAARFYAINPCAAALASGYLVRSRRYRTENKRFHLWHQRLVLDLCGSGGIGRRA
jgi:hypothetical protein